MFRNVRRSTPHKVPSDCATTVACLGLLYMRASSPKEPLPWYVKTSLPPFFAMNTPSSIV